MTPGFARSTVRGARPVPRRAGATALRPVPESSACARRPAHGVRTPVTALGAHLLFGAILGAFYRVLPG